MLLVGDDGIQEVLQGMEEVEEETGDVDMNATPEVSLNALVCQYNPKTLCLNGLSNQKKLQILIDTGSTQLFIETKLADKLPVNKTAIPLFKVTVASRAYLQQMDALSMWGIGVVLSQNGKEIYRQDGPSKPPGVDILSGANTKTTILLDHAAWIQF
ncbi:RVP_2 domain-containing protein [Senna tora]|uniref:RVP_2 domain-containing protein n=1 Tax=Senna tora TaxID=362788 RepID=A0A834WEV0_9FABA|nr:RVP_2 domain-containing protein [Senna tora]